MTRKILSTVAVMAMLSAAVPNLAMAESRPGPRPGPAPTVQAAHRPAPRPYSYPAPRYDGRRDDRRDGHRDSHGSFSIGFGDRHGYFGFGYRHGHWSVGIYSAPAPAYCPTPAYRWVPEHYEIRTVAREIPGYWQQTWVPPVYQTAYDPYGRPYQVLVRDGYYAQTWVPPQIVQEQVQVLVPGYWTY